MSIEEVESAILEMGPEERHRLLVWFDQHREDLFGRGAAADDLSAGQKAEMLRRRQEYNEHPERFIRVNEQSLDEMFARIRRHVAARLSSAG